MKLSTKLFLLMISLAVAERPAATAVFPRASREAPRAAETLGHPAAERKEQHRGVKNAMQLPEHDGLALNYRRRLLCRVFRLC